VPDVKHFDTEQVLAAVEQLFWRQGVASTGIQDIVSVTGLSRSSLYSTFGGKDELYLAALRDPGLRSVTESWMRRSRSVLERFVDPVTARGVDALIEGLVMHKVLSTGPVSRAETREIIARAVRPTAEGSTPDSEDAR